MDGPTEPASDGQGIVAGADRGGKGIAGGAGAKPRAKRFKAISVDGAREVRYYRLTVHELDFVAEPQRDAGRAGAVSAFAGGLLLNTIASLSFGTAFSPTAQGAWIAIALFALAGTTYYGYQWYRLTRLSETRLQRIKDEHDFE